MYDVIIIGAGPAGISASLYTIRRNLKTLVIYKKKSSLEKASRIENYYGFEDGINGKELYNKGIEQAKKLGVQVLNEEVTNIRIDMVEKNQIFKIETLNNEFFSKSVILATGNKKTRPNIENIEKYEGKGVSYCAICDGFFYRNKDVAILGNGDYAISELKELENIVGSITILTNGEKRKSYNLDNVKIIEKEIESVNRRCKNTRSKIQR